MRWVFAPAFFTRNSPVPTLTGEKDVAMEKKTSDIDFKNLVVNAMKEMMRLVDSNGVVLFANQQMVETFGNKAYETRALGEPARAIGEMKEYRVGDRIYEMVATKSNDASGSPVAVLETYRDVTEQRLMQADLMNKNEKMEEQMDLALRVQRALLPAKLPDTFPFSFHFGFEPCEKVGGDLYDVFDMGRGYCAFYIADVSGHGIVAAMLTVFLKQAARAYLKNEDYSPSRILSYIYEMFNELGLEDDIYITMFFGVLNTNDATITYANAGHNCAPLLYDGITVRELSLPSVPICRWFTRPGYKDRKVQMPTGSRLLLYTDGLPDCCAVFRDPENVKNRLFEAPTGEALIEDFLDAVRGEEEPSGRRDDIAILLLEREYDYCTGRAQQEG
jgi:sigma-B regulation protein RsbU (phosphoserine phosphatase)